MENTLFITGIFLLALAGCGENKDTICGSKRQFDLYLLGSSIVDTSYGAYYSYMEGNGIRVFQWSGTVSNVCPDEHVKANARVALLDESVTEISARGRIDWYILWSEEYAMTKSGSDLKGSGSAGLKQVFGEDPAEYYPVLEVYFPTKGSYSLDTAFLKQKVISIELQSDYYEFI